ncbi:MAG: bifunctional indole-3-glycerol-phosphate synthase TrpC/phosphoribosylanthranilate isomerase TrpF [Corynebacterium sp.]|nr:bifunctional indole-3-glycerol-phosphate synthase TrpC/phosphoribosylanthranilate isomerase TrpF [Corynebacterium sp.]
MAEIPTILQEIVQNRRSHVPGIAEHIQGMPEPTKSSRSLYRALNGANRFIMECKSASPSLGLIRADYRPGDIARIYSRYASAISVLCEPDRFGGDYDHLATVAASTHLPVLCKDFIIAPEQVRAARLFGADAILLMLSILSDSEYQELASIAGEYDLDILTEVISEEEMARAATLGARIIGINHRNLHDLTIDISRSAELAPLAPEGALVIAESGIRDHATVRDVAKHVNGFLVGSQLTGQPDVDRACRELVYGVNKVCGLTTPRAAQMARAAGAVYGGLIFEPASPRNVSRETSEKIMAAEPNLEYVAVSRRTENFSELNIAGVHAYQIHAPLQDSVAAEIALIDAAQAALPGKAIWRAVSMTDPRGAKYASALADHVDLLILDSGDGGTGESFDWSCIPGEVLQRSLLAGGIGPHNVLAAHKVGCRGVDVNSGVEYAHSVEKDATKLMSVFESIRKDR